MKTTNPLTILITRPQADAEALAVIVKKIGINPIVMPTLSIEPLLHDQIAEDIQRYLGSAKLVIFLSPNAVHYALPYLPKHKHWRSKIAAIGPGTANALKVANFSPDYLPETSFNSEGLLELSALQDVKNKNILIFAGVGGRELLINSLESRGANVQKIDVYRRVCPHLDKTAFQRFCEADAPKLILSTSVESLHNLIKMTGEKAFPILQQTPLLVISERMQLVAAQLGFVEINIIEGADNVSIYNYFADLLGSVKT